MEIEYLKKIPLFSELSTDELHGLSKLSKKRRYPRGNIVLYKGDAGDVIYLILEGKVKVVLSHSDGKEIILNTLISGDYFGEMSIFDHMPRSANIVAMEDCEFLAIPQKAITDQIKKNPQLAFKLLSIMSQRLREANEQISSLAYLDVKGRVAQTLMRLLKKSGKTTGEGYQVLPRPAMKDIADMSGTSRETVSRILNELAKQGIITYTKDSFIFYEDLVDDK